MLAKLITAMPSSHLVQMASQISCLCRAVLLTWVKGSPQGE